MNIPQTITKHLQHKYPQHTTKLTHQHPYTEITITNKQGHTLYINIWPETPTTLHTFNNNHNTYNNARNPNTTINLNTHNSIDQLEQLINTILTPI